MTISHYPTTVTMCIISNRPELLRQAIREWGSGADHWVCGTNQTLLDPLHLAFVHRTYMEQAFKNKGMPCCRPIAESSNYSNVYGPRSWFSCWYSDRCSGHAELFSSAASGRSCLMAR